MQHLLVTRVSNIPSSCSLSMFLVIRSYPRAFLALKFSYIFLANSLIVTGLISSQSFFFIVNIFHPLSALRRAKKHWTDTLQTAVPSPYYLFPVLYSFLNWRCLIPLLLFKENSQYRYHQLTASSTP